MSIDRNAKEPLYYQLKQLLIAQIEYGDFRPGDMLLTEEQLKEQYELSRTTIRHALGELELEGWVTRTRGRGTFVAQPKVVRQPGMSYRTLNPAQQDALNLNWRILTAKWIPASPEVAERLHVEPHTLIFRLRRLHLANNEPIGYHFAHVSPVFADAINREALDAGGPLTYLSGKGYLNGSLADRIIDAVEAGPKEEVLLNVEAGVPLLRIRRLVFSHDARPIEDLLAFYRGDRFQYQLENLPSIIPPDA